jgi:hypothetical protein
VNPTNTSSNYLTYYKLRVHCSLQEEDVVEYAAEHPYTVVEHRSNYSQVRVSSDVWECLGTMPLAA